LDLHRLEGVFIMLLCSFDESIRLDAYTALGVLRTLHQQLYTMAEELGVHVTNMPPATPQQQQQQQPPTPLQRQQQQQPQQAPGAAAAAAAGVAGGSFSSVSTFTAAEGAAAAAAAAGSSVASGSGMFFRHKATASRESADFMQALGEFLQALSVGLLAFGLPCLAVCVACLPAYMTVCRSLSFPACRLHSAEVPACAASSCAGHSVGMMSGFGQATIVLMLCVRAACCLMLVCCVRPAGDTRG
jgi:hypothetical protein